MNDLTYAALSSMIAEQFNAWYAQDDVINPIKEGLFQGCSETDSKDEVYSRMILNSMRIAAEASAAVIMGILLDSGVIKPVDEKRMIKSVLSVVKE